MMHLNGNILCAIACQVTGRQPYYHDLIQICILPLDADLDIDKSTLPFHIDIKPQRPENIDIEEIKTYRTEQHVNVDGDSFSMSPRQILDVASEGIHCFQAADLFERWFDKLELRPKKRISPLTHNWKFVYPFIMDWLGGEHNMNHFFDGRYRDTLSAASFLNDYCDWTIKNLPFPKINLKYLARQLNIENSGKGDALADCIKITNIYKRMLQNCLITLPPGSFSDKIEESDNDLTDYSEDRHVVVFDNNLHVRANTDSLSVEES